jgi:hypothetical protein
MCLGYLKKDTEDENLISHSGTEYCEVIWEKRYFVI